MSSHTYLDHGLTILQARLSSPLTSQPIAAEPTMHPFITISREACAGATTLGSLLMRTFDAPTDGEKGPSWVFLDKDLLTHALSHYHLPERLAEFLPEDRISEITGMIGELVGLHPSLWQLENQVAEAIHQLALMGRVIFVGRAAHLVTRTLPNGFHVRLVAPRETRIHRMMELQHCNANEAKGLIDKTDHARRRYVKTHFDRDIDDPRTYDLVINTERISPMSVAHLVLEGLNRKLADVAATTPIPA